MRICYRIYIFWHKISTTERLKWFFEAFKWIWKMTRFLFFFIVFEITTKNLTLIWNIQIRFHVLKKLVIFVHLMYQYVLLILHNINILQMCFDLLLIFNFGHQFLIWRNYVFLYWSLKENLRVYLVLVLMSEFELWLFR